MKHMLDMSLVNKLIGPVIITLSIVIVFRGVSTFNVNSETVREKNTINIIKKALIQCYALEGNFPSELIYLEKYGVVFDVDKYKYYYKTTNGNMNPDVRVTLLK
jgi:hypothetical protein